MDATIPFQIKPWEYEEMKNSYEKVNIGAFRDVKKAVFSSEGLLLYVNNNWNDYDDMIYTLLLTQEGGTQVLLVILGGGVPPGSPNPDSISNQTLSFSTQASQVHVMSVLCKLTFSQESRCRVKSNR